MITFQYDREYAILAENKLLYKGYAIDASPRRLDEGGWDTHFFIERHANGCVKIRGFSLAIRCKTRTEAVGYCLQAAQEIIDGDAAGMTVDDL